MAVKQHHHSTIRNIKRGGVDRLYQLWQIKRLVFTLSCGIIHNDLTSKASPKTTLLLPFRKHRFDASVLSQSSHRLCQNHKMLDWLKVYEFLFYFISSVPATSCVGTENDPTDCSSWSSLGSSALRLTSVWRVPAVYSLRYLGVTNTSDFTLAHSYMFEGGVVYNCSPGKEHCSAHFHHSAHLFLAFSSDLCMGIVQPNVCECSLAWQQTTCSCSQSLSGCVCAFEVIQITTRPVAD